MTYKLFKLAIGVAFLALTLIGAAFAQDAGADPVALTKEACAALLADNGALVTKWIAILGGSTFVASVLANFKRLQSLPVLGLFLNIVAANWATWLRIAAQRASKSGVAIVAIVIVSFQLAACTLPGAPVPTAQITQGQAQANLETALYFLKAGGCIAATLGTAAAPIVAMSADAKGQQVLQAVDATGANICQVSVPPSALPVPAAPNAPPISVPLPAAPAKAS